MYRDRIRKKKRLSVPMNSCIMATVDAGRWNYKETGRVQSGGEEVH